MIDLKRLQTTLLQAKLQRDNNPLYQVISQLLAALKELQDELAAASSSAGLISTGPFLLHSPDLGDFPNSKSELAGNFISFDDSVFGFRTINGSEWSVLTNGDATYPELIFAGGDVIMIHVP